MTLSRLRPLVALMVCAASTTALGQSPRDTASAKGFASLGALMASLPAVTAPSLDEANAFWLASLSLGCIDQLQPRPTGRSGPQQRGNATPVGAVPLPQRDSTLRGPGREDETVPYFWITTYEILPNYARNRAFWGCIDWGSSASSTWVLTKILSGFARPPAMADLMREALVTHLGALNVEGEIEYLKDAAATASLGVTSPGRATVFQRPYGFAWVLKLYADARTSTDSATRRLSTNLEPLAQWLRGSLIEYLAALDAPVRAGSQTNTAYILGLAQDYVDGTGDPAMRASVATTAGRLFLADTSCAVAREVLRATPGPRDSSARTPVPNSAATRAPAGVNDLTALADAARRDSVNGITAIGAVNTTIVSPCLAEAALMARLVASPQYVAWLNRFLPALESAAFAPLTAATIDEPVEADRARFVSVSLHRAQALRTIARALGDADPRTAVLHRLSAMHASRGLAHMRSETRGAHWLPAIAVSFLTDTAVVQGGTVPPLVAAARARNDSAGRGAAKPRGYASLQELYAALPAMTPREFDRRTAHIVAITAASCLDNPQGAAGGTAYLWQPVSTPVADYESTRAFYGCFDWHSHVNSTWALVRILKEYPDLTIAPMIRAKLNRHLAASPIAGELAYFSHPALGASIEIPYGFAWVLRLQYELATWKDADAARWSANLKPLATYMAGALGAYLRQLPGPARPGVHFNTALMMRNSIDYATRFDPALATQMRTFALQHFAKDVNCNTDTELGAADFLSPCLTEAAVMGRILDQAAYVRWLDAFLPALHSEKFAPLTDIVDPTKFTNRGARSHYLGLGFTRAASLREIAGALPPNDARVPVLLRLAANHGEKAFELLAAVGYDGTHYAASMAMMYIEPGLRKWGLSA